METLRAQLAGLFDTTPKSLRLDPISGGLTFSSYQCKFGKNIYFVKVYPVAKNAAKEMQRINTLILTMREHGIPAPEIALYSPLAPNIAIHKFVQGQHYVGEPGQLEAVAQLCSKIIMLGLTNRQEKPREAYSSSLAEISKELDKMPAPNSAADRMLHDRILTFTESVLDILHRELPSHSMLHIPVHDDFNEKNILLQGSEVVLLCDWDSFRVKLLKEYLACCAARFATTSPLSGELELQKLLVFFRHLDKGVMTGITQPEAFAHLFPLLATLKHLRSYPFRASLVQQGRPDLRMSLLDWPASHCEWMLSNRSQVSDWVLQALG